MDKLVALQASLNSMVRHVAKNMSRTELEDEFYFAHAADFRSLPSEEDAVELIADFCDQYAEKLQDFTG